MGGSTADLWRLKSEPDGPIHRLDFKPMDGMDMYPQVRMAVMVEGMSIRESSLVFGLHRDTVRKMVV